MAAHRPAPRNLLPCDGQVRLWPDWLPAAVADGAFAALRDCLGLAPEQLWMFGRAVTVPRLVAWHGEPGTAYTYAGRRHVAHGWPAPLAPLVDRLAATTGLRFNGVLCNLYRDGRDHMGWHADDEASLGPEPTLASVSLGAARAFDLRHRARGLRLRVLLPHGSLLVMAGASQQAWQHRLPPRPAGIGARLNLTFRRLGHGAGRS